MSAITLIVTSTAAHLITDGSFYGTDHRLLQIRSKVTSAECFQVAIACTGCVDRNRIAHGLAGIETQDEAIARLIPLCAALRAENDVMEPSRAGTGTNDLQLFAIMWSSARNRAEGYAISSSKAWFGDHYQPGTLLSAEFVSSPPVPASMFDEGCSAESARSILNRQRGATWSDQTAHGVTFVGGFGELTTIDVHGIHQSRVCDWNDEVGKVIKV